MTESEIPALLERIAAALERLAPPPAQPEAFDNARLYQEAREADRRKDEVLAMLGHELRNPLSPIVTALQLMGMKTSSAASAAGSRKAEANRLAMSSKGKGSTAPRVRSTMIR